MARKLELTGQHFGNWEVLYECAERNKQGSVMWHCRCACGTEKDVRGADLKNGATKSCGCLRGVITSKNNKKDLVNKRFGRLIVLEETPERKNGMIVWKCQCDCGNIIFTPTSYLTTGDTQSCGCLQKDRIHEACSSHLEGMRFGKLTVIEETPQRQGKNIIWKCQCDCGNITYVPTSSLQGGLTQSCGCLKSKGELTISTLLRENNIPFLTQKSFETCRFPSTNALAKFDFYINDAYLVEFDGEQHFHTNKRGWNTMEQFIATQERDKYKNQWCKENNIPLIRIPYTQLDNLDIQDLLLETSNFVI